MMGDERKCIVCGAIGGHLENCPEGWWVDWLRDGWSQACPHAVWGFACEWLRDAIDADYELVSEQITERTAYMVTLGQRMNGDVSGGDDE